MPLVDHWQQEVRNQGQKRLPGDKGQGTPTSLRFPTDIMYEHKSQESGSNITHFRWKNLKEIVRKE